MEVNTAFINSRATYLQKSTHGAAMPDIICLLSSSPPRYSLSPPPPPLPKKQFRRPAEASHDSSRPQIPHQHKSNPDPNDSRRLRYDSPGHVAADWTLKLEQNNSTALPCERRWRTIKTHSSQRCIVIDDEETSVRSIHSLPDPLPRGTALLGPTECCDVQENRNTAMSARPNPRPTLTLNSGESKSGTTATVSLASPQMESDFMFLESEPETLPADNSNQRYSSNHRLNSKRLGGTRSEPQTKNRMRATSVLVSKNTSTEMGEFEGTPKKSGSDLDRGSRLLKALDSDPITFTSSPDLVPLTNLRQNRQISSLKTDSVGERSQMIVVAPIRSTMDIVSDGDSDDLPELPSMHLRASRPFSRTISDVSECRNGGTKYRKLDKGAEPFYSLPLKRVSRTADEKALEAASKTAAKEAAAKKRKAEREEKARDRVIAADLAKVNTLKTDKKKSTPEMIVTFSSQLDIKLKEQCGGFLAKLNVECKEWGEAEQFPQNCVAWSRKLEAVYDEELDLWQPVTKRIEDEKHILVYMPAQSFVDLATSTATGDLGAHACRLKARFHGYKLIYLIEGLQKWQQKNKTNRNRAFVATVRRDPNSRFSNASATGKRKAGQEYIDDDLIEDALLRLQINHGALIHHTAALVESAEWISIFTQHISTIPYRRQRMNLDTAFCMESGQVRTGEDAKDTYAKMLCEIGRLTASVAWGIQAQYETLPKLVTGLSHEGKEALKEVRKSANKDGAFTERTVGKALSKRVWSVFLGRDPRSTEV